MEKRVLKENGFLVASLTLLAVELALALLVSLSVVNSSGAATVTDPRHHHRAPEVNKASPEPVPIFVPR